MSELEYLLMELDIKRKNAIYKASKFYEKHKSEIEDALFLAERCVLSLTPALVSRLYSKRVAETTFCDMNTGIKWRSTRPLSKAEKLELEALVYEGSLGSGVGAVLKDMGLLKG